MRIWKKEWVRIVLLLTLALGTRLYAFGYPHEIVFDEVYFGQFVSQYFSHSYYFDIHPPLAKLLMAGAAQLTGTHPDPTFKFAAISTPYEGNFYKLLRGVVTLFGVLLPIAVYYLAKYLFKDDTTAFFAGLLAVLDNALLVQSRYILTDIFMLTFGIGGLALLLRAYARSAHPLTRASFWTAVALLGCAVSVKWTGLIFLGVGIWITIYAPQTKWRKKLLHTGALIGGVLILYTACMTLHLQLLSYAGPGNAFMSQEFQKTLIGTQASLRADISSKPLLARIIELNKVMFTANKNITQGHPYGSKWFSWPFMIRPVYYWNSPFGAQEARIYLLGNPILWWSILLAAVTEAFLCLKAAFKKKEEFFPLSVLALGFFGNLFPYIFISRVSFLYHYLPSLLFGIICLAYFLRRWKMRPLYQGILLTLIAVAFIYFAPLSYGSPLTPSQFEQHIWLGTWK